VSAAAATRLASHPAVVQVAQASIVPFGATAVMDIRVPGASGAPDEGRQPSWSAVGPGYFGAVGMRLVRGRLFETRDIAGEPVALVNEPMASAFENVRDRGCAGMSPAAQGLLPRPQSHNTATRRIPTIVHHGDPRRTIVHGDGNDMILLNHIVNACVLP
jgi:hypothetical protein